MIKISLKTKKSKKMEDRFVKDFDLSFDSQLLVDYEIEIRNEIKSLLDDFKKENYLFYLEVNRQEAKFWVEIINKYSHFIKKKEEKFKRLSKIVYQYNSLCDVCDKISSIFCDLKKIKSK